MMNIDTFAGLLLSWWSENKRQLPWKNSHDPYIIWISEIILQQTRVKQGTPYFLKFVHTFPDIQTLADASEDDVMKAWEGLGYYSRARNLQHTAKVLASNHGGKFPDTYEEIIQLKGIGPYTAAAIASFAFGLSYPVVDGNVVRVVSRVNGILEPVDNKATLQSIYGYVNKAIQGHDPASFNQALMDFGSAVCVPASPACILCPMTDYCMANKDQKTQLIPFKAKKVSRKNRYYHYFYLDRPDRQMIITQRTGSDIWKKLYELPMVETEDESVPVRGLITQKLGFWFSHLKDDDYIMEEVYHSRQVLTHRNVYGFFYRIVMINPAIKINKGQYLVEREKVSNFAFPKIISDYLKSIDS